MLTYFLSFHKFNSHLTSTWKSIEYSSTSYARLSARVLLMTSCVQTLDTCLTHSLTVVGLRNVHCVISSFSPIHIATARYRDHTSLQHTAVRATVKKSDIVCLFTNETSSVPKSWGENSTQCRWKCSLKLKKKLRRTRTCFHAYRDNLIIQICNKITNSIRYASQNFALAQAAKCREIEWHYITHCILPVKLIWNFQFCLL